MKKNVVLLIFLLITGLTFSQNGINYYQHIPKGYQLRDANGESGPAVKSDFDRDGIQDLALILYNSEDGTPIFCIYSSSNFNNSRSIIYCEWVFMMHDLSVSNGIITLRSDNGSMGQYGELKMTYDTIKKAFKIIGYEDDLGSKSVTFSSLKL